MSKEMRKVCPHCEERLAPRTLREHARLFFDARSRTWTKKKKISSAIEDNEIEKAAVFDDEEIRELQGTDQSMLEECRTTDQDMQDQETEESVHLSWNPVDDTEKSDEIEMEDEVESEFESDSDTDDSDTEFPENHIEDPPNKFADLFRWLLILILFWHIAHNISASAVNELVQFVSTTFSVIGSSPVMMGLSAFPASLFLAYKYLKVESDAFAKYVICPKCYSLYDYDEMIRDPSGALSIKRCTYIKFPLHPQRNRRISCSTPLVKRIHYSNGSMRLHALHCYVNKSLRDALQRILIRKDIHLKLESWRNRNIPDGFYADVYDGRVWKSFIDKLFHEKRTLGLMINVDWFQPFKHCTDSIGAIYLVIMNLPRKERYKRENIILAGLLPPLEAEPNTLNPFLTPLVHELNDLWTGIHFYTSESPKYKVLVKGALICAACDIPAARKLCGFKGHNAHRGCSKCFKHFPGLMANKDYSGFDRNNWPQRDISTHRDISKKIKYAKTAQSRNELEIEHGVYYSIISELEYFNPIRHCIIDPMHNLFLGTAKRVFKKIWIPKGILKDRELKEIQARVDSVIVPSTIGRIPKKIASAFGGFTAEQWMNWTTVYSLFALRGLIAEEHYRCWESFVIACRLLSNPVLSDIMIKKADLLLLHFCRKVEELYGKSEVTPNMHLHCHLTDCVFDYGPVFGFWLYSFERYNGMLGKFPNNQKHIEVQIMRRFETEMQLYSLDLPQTYHEYFCNFLKKQSVFDKSTDDHEIEVSDFSLYNFSNGNLQEDDPMLLFSYRWKFPSRYIVHLLPDSEFVPFSRGLRTIFSDSEFIPTFNDLPRTTRRYKYIEFGAEVFSVFNDSRYGRHSYILANWAGEGGDIDSNHGLRPARIKYIFLYQFTSSDGVAHSLVMAMVEWYKSHPNKRTFGTALELYRRNEFESFGPSSYIPIACIKTKFAPAYGSISIVDHACSSSSTHESVLFICPLRSKTYL